MNDSVDSDALVMPSSSGSYVGGAAALGLDLLVGLDQVPLVDVLADQVVGVARILDAHPAQHLRGRSSRCACR